MDISSICVLLTCKQRNLCVSGHTAGSGSPLPGSSEGQTGEEEGGTKQASSLTAFETVVPLIPDFANRQWPCSFSGCGPRELLESTKSSMLIQRDQGENTQRNRSTPQEGAARFAPACSNLWGSKFVRANTFLINYLASWSFSSLASSVSYQKTCRKSNPKPLLTVAQEGKVVV